MGLVVKKWVLTIEIDGEWEQCLFMTRKDALAAFLALATDYQSTRAMLLRAEADVFPLYSFSGEQPPQRQVN
jgi:hypothetical protein